MNDFQKSVLYSKTDLDIVNISRKKDKWDHYYYLSSIFYRYKGLVFCSELNLDFTPTSNKTDFTYKSSFVEREITKNRNLFDSVLIDHEGNTIVCNKDKALFFHNHVHFFICRLYDVGLIYHDIKPFELSFLIPIEEMFNRGEEFSFIYDYILELYNVKKDIAEDLIMFR